jgi:RNA polymerase sigma factor (sigma-70 family)
MEASAASGPVLDAGGRRWLRRSGGASDERLVAAVRAGSERAFEAIFERYQRGLLAFCRHMLGSLEEAEDAVQHVFLAAYSGISASERPLELRPWLFTIARNRCISIQRARRERPSSQPVDAVTEHLSAEVQRRQDVRDLLADVARLPEDQRAALVLAELGTMPHAEIATVLGCPREKVKSLVFQARSSLIASRDGRETPCTEIRRRLSTERGGALRRTAIRRHLRDCAGCRAFRAELRRQHRLLALILPVAPSAALQAAILGGEAVGGGAAVGSATLGGSGALALKALTVVAVAAGGAGGATVVRTHEPPAPRPVAAAAHSAPTASPASIRVQAGAGAPARIAAPGAGASRAAREAPRAKGAARASRARSAARAGGDAFPRRSARGPSARGRVAAKAKPRRLKPRPGAAVQLRSTRPVNPHRAGGRPAAKTAPAKRREARRPATPAKQPSRNGPPAGAGASGPAPTPAGSPAPAPGRGKRPDTPSES